ncbi:hypothetical protein [Undibacterium oligocarboniphilum]|nr:hypothetical protein [Undibacterium oligocarboniphilum]
MEMVYSEKEAAGSVTKNAAGNGLFSLSGVKTIGNIGLKLWSM